LIEREDIHPAPYVGRYKWVILERLDALRSDELKECIRFSYEMVAARAPKKKAPKESENARRSGVTRRKPRPKPRTTKR